MSTRDERLFQFFAAYFHQDWDADAEGWEDVVDEYAADNPAGVEQTVDDLRSWLGDECGSSLADLGSEFLPSRMSDRDWVERIVARLSGGG